MASYNELNALIDAYINRNGVQAITGQILNGVLKAMVEQLGRGYTIMGAAIPTTDPGTPDGPECYFASETGTYTDFDGLQVAPGELALLCYTPSDGWTKATIYEGFQEVQATIDGNVGTPSVGVSYAGGVLSFDFHNMKGNPGQNGQDGAAAGFGTIGADITGGVGTPAVSVESSGPATAKNLQFHFTNLKGETGVTSVVATVDNTTGTPACTVSLEGQQLTLAFSGLKGAQGDTGSSVDYPFTIVNNLTTDDATQALSAAQGVVLEGEITQLEAEVTDLENKISESNLNIVPTTKVAGLKMRTTGLTADANAVLYYFPATANVAYILSWRNTSAGTIRICYSSVIPAVGVTGFDNYKTKSASEGGTTLTPSTSCYICIGMDTAFGTGDPKAETIKTSGIGLDVKQLKQDVVDINSILDESLIYNEPFDLVSTQICDGSDSRYPAGRLATNQNAKTSLLIPSENVGKIVYSLYAATANAGLAIAFYDSEKVFISGLKSDYTTETTLLSSDFPEGTAYIRISTSVGTGRYAKAYCNKDLLEVANAFSTFKKETDNGVFAPLPIYWAACGDSIVHANHSGIPTLSDDDPYKPIDDYTDKAGYANANSGAHPNFVYYFCKKERIQWANYGYGGTILGNYIPKYLGANNYLYPFVDNRITQFKAGVTWDYISILFGWNDNIHGPIYQRDKWLTATYGEDLGYPMTEEQVGTAGFANATQKAACDALGDDYYFDAFIGTINDNGTDTFYGAYNYAVDYLMRHFPTAKIMVMAPFIGGNDRSHSQKFRAAVLAIAAKFGLPCFDFNDLEWWYYTTVINSTPFANPDRQDGRWVKMNGETAPATIEGFNRARFCADSVHPTPLGYEWIADPIGYTLLQK